MPYQKIGSMIVQQRTEMFLIATSYRQSGGLSEVAFGAPTQIP
jgi:hypothetical protein